MRREIIGLFFATALAASIGAAHAQPQERVRTLGIVIPSHPSSARHLEPLRQGLHERGWIEGRSIRLEIRYVSGYEQFAATIAEFVRLPVDAIYVTSAVAALAAKAATTSIPIVFWIGADPVSAGLVESYSRPGRNLTGIAGFLPEGVAKHIELLLEAVPRIRRVALLVNPDNPSAVPAVQHAERAARDLGLQLHVVKVRDAPELTRAFAQMTRTSIDALVVVGAVALPLETERIASFAIANRLPMGSVLPVGMPGVFDDACLLQHGPSQPDAMRRVAHYIDRILKGAKPADLPVERAPRYQLVVNLRVARAIGVVVPDHLLRIADEVIE